VLPNPKQIYRVTSPDSRSPLRQGEILSNVVQIQSDVSTIGQDSVGIIRSVQAFAIILTQDCDLEQDHRIRFSDIPNPVKMISNVLLCEVTTAQDSINLLKEKVQSSTWRRIVQNNDQRYHFLESVRPGCDHAYEGIPELVIDFKRYFSLPVAELYRRIEIQGTIRRTLMVSPYMEQVCRRFANYLSRIALPQDHSSD